MRLVQHFAVASIPVVATAPEQRVEISQWLMPGTPLVSVEEGGKEKAYRLVAGSGVTLSADGSSLLAAEAGYPYLESSDEDGVVVVTGHLEPLIEISVDAWTAKLTLYPAVQGQMIPATETILDLLGQAGVGYGIREKAIAAACESVRTKTEVIQRLVVAKGRLPVNGQDGRLRVELDVDLRAGKERSDGSMDYRERNAFLPVEKNQLLARIMRATSGVAGVNIFGHEVPQIPGEELAFDPGADVLYDEQSGEIRAAFAGVLSVVGTTELRVTEQHRIDGDVDYSTGNVSSKAAVEITGSVMPGFTVSARGNIVIGGNIEGGIIEGGANLVVKGGVTGKNTRISAAGDISLHFVEDGTVVSGNSVTVGQGAYYTKISADGSIRFDGQSRVVASSLTAGEGLELNDVDTETSGNSKLAAACAPDRYRSYERLLKEVAEKKHKLSRLSLRFGLGDNAPTLQEATVDLEKSQQTLERFNVVPDAPEGDRSGGLRYASRQKITIGGTIQAGASVRIGNTQTVVPQKLKEGHFCLQVDAEKIVFRPADPGQQVLSMDQLRSQPHRKE